MNKKEFKRKLSGEPVDWKEYAMCQITLLVEAELREKKKDPSSEYFKELEKMLYKRLKLSDEQIDAIDLELMNWLSDNS